MTEVTHKGVKLGHEHRYGPILIFFGNASCDLERLKPAYPHLDFYFIKQVHGNKVVPASKELVEADAHFTSEAKKALCIKTADCLPVMLSAGDRICAIHAGWRGLDSEILLEAQKLISKNPPSETLAAIGPHIHCKSFEVDKGLADGLQKKYSELNPSGLKASLPTTLIRTHSDTAKAFVDLNSLAQAQLMAGGINKNQILMLSKDTFSSSEYHSYRRDKELAGRQLSFIAIDRP